MGAFTRLILSLKSAVIDKLKLLTMIFPKEVICMSSNITALPRLFLQKEVTSERMTFLSTANVKNIFNAKSAAKISEISKINKTAGFLNLAAFIINQLFACSPVKPDSITFLVSLMSFSIVS